MRLSWIRALKSMMGVLIRERKKKGRTDIETQGEGNVKMEIGIEELNLQTKEHQRLLAVSRS